MDLLDPIEEDIGIEVDQMGFGAGKIEQKSLLDIFGQKQWGALIDVKAQDMKVEIAFGFGYIDGTIETTRDKWIYCHHRGADHHIVVVDFEIGLFEIKIETFDGHERVLCTKSSLYIGGEIFENYLYIEICLQHSLFLYDRYLYAVCGQKLFDIFVERTGSTKMQKQVASSLAYTIDRHFGASKIFV